MTNIEKPKVFISYAWTNDEYTNRVANFVKRLRSDGIDTLFDQFDLLAGNSLNNFMEKCVLDPTVTHVLMLLNPAYKEKADKRSGGAGRETQIISEEVYSDLDNSKFKPIIFDVEDKSVAEVVPVYLKNRMFIDLSNLDTFEENYRALVREIYGKPHMVKNQIGLRPDWVDDSKQMDLNYNKLNLIKESMYKGIEKNTFRYSLQSLKTEFNTIISNIDYGSINVDNYEEEYKKINPLRNFVVAVINELIELDKLSEFIVDFFEYYDTEMSKYRKSNSPMYLILKILKHELIIEIIALLYKNKKFRIIYNLITYGYETNNGWNPCASFHDFFYCMTESAIYIFDQNLGKHFTDGIYYKLTGIGDCWSRNMPVQYISLDDFVNADILLCSLTGIINNDRWFAISYVYKDDDNLWINTLETALKSKRLYMRYSELFGNMEEDKLKECIKRDHTNKDNSWYGYHNCNRRIPIMFDRNYDDNLLFLD